MNKQVLLTEDGLKALEDELEELKTVKRREIAENIKVALSFGDLSENSEYDEAKNDQAMVEARIASIENMLKNVKIIDEQELSTDIINVGAKVRLYDVEFDETCEYRIVGSNEANPDIGRISDESPVGTTSTELSRTSALSSVSLLISSLPLLILLSGTSTTSPVTPL